MNTLKITLTPLDKFFFGGEDLFGNNDSVFYFQISRGFPQQTTLLGLVRHQILLQNGLMNQGKIDPSKSPADWIGAQSFSAGVGTPNFGKIKQLSPAFISQKGERLRPHWRAKHKNATAKDFMFGATITASFHSNVIQNDIKDVDNYDAKEGIEQGFTNTVTGSYLADDEVYAHEDAQIGINKMDRISSAMTDDEGFYKFKHSRLKPDFAFSFYLELDSGVTLADTVITMGKERSPFDMKVENVSTNPLQRPTSLGKNEIVLLSDAYVLPEIYDHCEVIIAETISFKNIENTLTTPNFAGKPNWSKRLHLLKRGTILHIKNNQMVQVQKLLDINNFQTIGYNFYTNY